MNILLILSCLAACLTCEAKSFYPDAPSVYIPYSNQASNKSPRVYVGFDGSSNYVELIMDTGSVGLIVSKDIFTPKSDAKNLGPGRQVYTSSGIIEEGTWWTATQQFYDKNGTLVATAEVPVLQVTSIKCTADARSCTPTDNPKGVTVMGIGFARESAEQPLGTPAYNAFLNVTGIVIDNKLEKRPANWCNGYVISPNGVHLGLNADNTGNAGFVKLEPWQEFSSTDLPEWHAAPMTLILNGTGQAGNILMDTGVDTAFVSPPSGSNVGTLVPCPDSARVECAPNGDLFEIYLPDQANPVAYYRFTLGDSNNPMQPNGAHVVSDTNVFLNTSRHVLDGMNIIYDNKHGYIGYVWNELSPGSVGYVDPAQVTPRVILTASEKIVKPTDNVTVLATVLGATQDGTPTGGITFIIDKVREYVPLDSNGQATLSVNFTHDGTYKVCASYSGDSTYTRACSNPCKIKVK